MSEPHAEKTPGFAPGSYECRCSYCGEVFEGHKRSVACLPCAQIVARGHQPLVEWGSDAEREAFAAASSHQSPQEKTDV